MNAETKNEPNGHPNEDPADSFKTYLEYNKVLRTYGYVYMAGYQARFRGTWQYRLSDWFTEAIWFDIAVDVITIACFGAAAWQMLTIFAKSG